jgi:hypothetical protein
MDSGSSPANGGYRTHYLFASQDEVQFIVEQTGRSVSNIVESQRPGFVAILEKA